jgi:hypothetical protein
LSEIVGAEAPHAAVGFQRAGVRDAGGDRDPVGGAADPLGRVAIGFVAEPQAPVGILAPAVQDSEARSAGVRITRVDEHPERRILGLGTGAVGLPGR